MDRSTLTSYLQALYTEYDESIPTTVGSAVYMKIITPLLEKFGDDPYTGDIGDFITDILQSEFPEMDFSALSSYADIVVTPFKVILDPLRRELLRLRMAQSLYYKEYLTDEEIEGLVSVFQVLREQGSRATVRVRIYVRTPRVLEVNFGATAYTAGGYSYAPIQFYKFTPEEVAQNRDGDYFYVEATFEAVEEGSGYSIGPNKITGLNGVVGAVWATNPASSSPGSDRETIDEYTERLVTWVSEHAPVTAAGITAKVMELFPSITDIFVVGNGDDLMYRDILRFTATTDASLAVGGGEGALEECFPGGMSFLPALPYTNAISGDFALTRPPYTRADPDKIVVAGEEFDILTLTDVLCTFDSFNPADSLGGYGGKTTLTYSLPNGVVIPHTLGLAQSGVDMSDIGVGYTALIYDDIGLVYDEYPVLGSTTQLALLKGPPEIIQASPTAPTGFELHQMTNFGGALMFRSFHGGAVTTYHDFTASRPVAVGDHLVGMIGVTSIEYRVTYVSSEFIYVEKIDALSVPVDPVEVVAGTLTGVNIPMFQVTDTGVDFDALGVGAGYSLWDEDAEVGASIDSVIGLNTLNLFDYPWLSLIKAGHDYKVFTYSPAAYFDSWVIYRRADDDYQNDFGAGQSNLKWAILDADDRLVAYTANPTYWNARLTAEENDFIIEASLPDGTSEVTSNGTIHLGGCTDVYMATDEDAAVGEFDGVHDLTPYMTAKGSWTAGERLLTLTDVVFSEEFSGIYPNPAEAFQPAIFVGGSVEIGDETPRRVYPVVGTGDSAVIVPDAFSDSGTERDVLVYGRHKIDLLSAKNLKMSGTTAMVGFSTFVYLGSAVPEDVVRGDTFEILSLKGKGTYEIDAVHLGGLVVKLVSAVETFDSGVRFEIYSTDDGINAPVSRFDKVELRTTSGSTKMDLHYREPVACRVMGDSVTDGPDVIIPPDDETGDYGEYLGSVAHVVPTEPGSFSNRMGLFAWSGDVEVIGVREGDVLLLRGTLNNYAARILVAEFSQDDEQSYILYYTYGDVTVDEDDVGFEIHAPQVATVRLYFENPVYAYLGFLYPGLMTTFTYGNYTYSSHADYKEVVDPGVDDPMLSINALAGPTDLIGTYSSLEFAAMGLKVGDIILLKYTSVISGSLPDDMNVAGKSFIMSVAGKTKTIFFQGTDPITLDSDDGVRGQLETAYPDVTFDVREFGGVTRLHLVSNLKITVTGGSSLTDFGIVAGSTNDNLPESIKGDHTIVGFEADNKIKTDSVFTQSVVGDGYATGVFIRTGSTEVTPSEMAERTEFGFYYTDLEVRSREDAQGSKLLENSYLSIGGYYYTTGFSILTDVETSFGSSEDPYMYLSPTVYNSEDEVMAVASYALNVHYFQAPTVGSVQDVLSSSDVRATADNMMAKQKPLLEIGVGPLIYVGDTDDVVQSIRERVLGRVTELVAAGKTVRLSDILGSVTPLGVDYDGDATLVWYYTDLRRGRHLRFGDELTVDRTWRISVPEDMIIFQES